MINTLKNIAFVVEEGAEDGHSDLGDHAAQLAQTHDAHLIGIYAIDTASGHRASGHARGAYSRSRMYQRLFGGVTTTLLAETPVPLLISD